MAAIHEQFEAEIRRLTKPLNRQFPRPWMTNLLDALTAKLFIVGRNQATIYPSDKLTHEEHLDALFNRPPAFCSELYKKMRDGRASPTRRNICVLRGILEREGIDGILETNVVCYGTRRFRDLSLPEHKGGRERGEEIFRTLRRLVNPKVLIAHGSGTGKDLGKFLAQALPAPPPEYAAPQPIFVDGMTVFVIRSLAPPEWSKWCGWAEPYLTEVARAAALAL